MARSVIVVGAGVFGAAAALELRRRGFEVSLADPGPLPHPDASSTDISKVVRMDYGSDELYVALAEEALAGWEEWNRTWGDPPYHGDGVLFVSRGPMREGGFEHDSFAMLGKRGHRLERVDRQSLGGRFPAWAAGPYVDGYFNPRGGWAESTRTVARLVDLARAAGARVLEGARFARLIEDGPRIGGIVTAKAEALRSDLVLVAAGAWTPALLPHLGEVLRAVAQPVLYFEPRDPTPYRPPHFPVWCADISNTGWYGFPATTDGILKVANHGPGRPVHPAEPREVDPVEEERFRDFFRDSLPGLVDAPLVRSRLCLYEDTWDGNFWIDHDPDRPGLVVASGGSGHGFKFAPVLGRIIADVVERKPNPYAPRFAWRQTGKQTTEQARHGTG